MSSPTSTTEPTTDPRKLPPKLPIEIRRSRHNPIIGKGKCMIPKCKKQSEYILYFLIGPDLNIKSLRGALCQTHAEEEQEDYSRFNRETRIEPIDAINQRTQFMIDKQMNEAKKK